MSDDVEMYTVEAVLAKKLDNENGVVYFVKWKDYSHEQNTWEPRESFVSSAHLIDEFAQDAKVGLP